MLAMRHILLVLLLLAGLLLAAPALADSASDLVDQASSGSSGTEMSYGDSAYLALQQIPLFGAGRLVASMTRGTVNGISWLFAGNAGDGQNFSTVYDDIGGNSCTFCGFVGRFAQIVDSFAKNTFRALQGPAANILTYLFALWVAFMAGAVALGVGAGNSPMGFAWVLAKRLTLFFFLYFLINAQSSSTYWDWFYDAPMEISADLSDLVISTTPQIMSRQTSAGTDCFTPIPAGLTKTSSGAAPPIQTATLMKFVCQVQVAESINKIGVAAAISNVRTAAKFSWSLAFIGNIIMAVIAGLIILFVFGVAMFYYTFLIIDVFFRVAFISALAPIFIVFFFLQGTRSWAQQMINGLVASFATLFGANMVYSVVGTLLAYLPEVTLTSPSVVKAAKAAKIAIGNASNVKIDEMFDILNAAGQYLDWGSAGLWYLLMSGLLAYAMSRRIGEMFSSIFGGFNPNFNMAESVTKVVQTGANLAVMAGGFMGGAVMKQMMMNRSFASGLSQVMGQAMGGNRMNSVDPRNFGGGGGLGGGGLGGGGVP